MNRLPTSRFRNERARSALVTALLLANVAGGTAAVIARVTASDAPAATVHRAEAKATVPTPTTVPTGLTTPTTAAQPVDCGQGSAAARAVLTRTGDVYDLSTRVTNETDRPIEIDRLTVRAVYPDGTKELAVPTAGLRVETASKPVEGSFAVPDGRSAIRPSRFEIAEFRFHPAGQPECASH